MRDHREASEAAVRIADLPPVGDGIQQGTRSTRAVIRAEHAKVMCVIINGALP